MFLSRHDSTAIARAGGAAASSAASVRGASLHYVSDGGAGMSRRRAGRRFVYFDPAGRRVRDPEVIARVTALAIPPAYTNVWICPDPDGHIQATARDARGRKQYRYHPRWRAVRDATKFERMLAFGKALPRIRKQVEADLARPGMPREKVLATVVRLLETTLDARRQRRVREAQPLLRPHHAGEPAREPVRQRRALRIQGQERNRPPGNGAGAAHRPHHPALPGPAGTRSLQLPRRGRRAASDQIDRRQRLPAGGRRRGFHRQGLPDVGRERARHVAARAPAAGAAAGGAVERRGGDESRCGAARQHGGHLPQVVRPPRRCARPTSRAR